MNKIDMRRNGIGDVKFEDGTDVTKEALDELINHLMEVGQLVLRYAKGFSTMRGGNYVKPKDLKKAIRFRQTGFDKEIMKKDTE